VSRLTLVIRFVTRPWSLAVIVIVLIALALLVFGGFRRAGRRRTASRVTRRNRSRGYGTGWDA
jgi:Tfp pilus assembly protein PilX